MTATHKAKVYLDTSVISALYDDRTPERMKLTEQAWQGLNEYMVSISELVVEELEAAPESKREKFLKTISEFEVLQKSQEAKELANIYIKQEIFPEKYRDDALHVAIASVNNIQYLLSWNFEHLVKVKTRKMVSLINTKLDYNQIEIIVPPEL